MTVIMMINVALIAFTIITTAVVLIAAAFTLVIVNTSITVINVVTSAAAAACRFCCHHFQQLLVCYRFHYGFITIPVAVTATLTGLELGLKLLVGEGARVEESQGCLSAVSGAALLQVRYILP